MATISRYIALGTSLQRRFPSATIYRNPVAAISVWHFYIRRDRIKIVRFYPVFLELKTPILYLLYFVMCVCHFTLNSACI